MTEPRARRDWFTSSYSANGADCVEVQHDETGTEVRDSKNRPAATLTFPARLWASFLPTH